ncbi:MAG: NAD(P)-dependent oxidoreductase [Gammaproteobacteria bacterium]|nr:NAD(P)-dependent oxidoreductase [Gammaproteobacteria bacterium]
MDIGFIGLGNMGSAIAARLLGAGHRLRVWNRSPQPLEPLIAAGAVAAESAREACAAEVVFSILSDDAAVREVLLPAALSAAPGTVQVNMATTSPQLSDELAARLGAAGCGYIAAPVLGRPDVAAAGKLNILAAGAPADLDRVQGLFDVIGQKTWRFGERPAQANVVKLAMNFMLAAAIESMGEAAALASGYAIEPAKLFELVSQTFFPGMVYQGYGRVIAESRYEPAGFKARLGLKDVRLALAAAEAVNAPLPFASLMRDSLLEGLARGEGEREFGAVLGRAPLRRAGR